MKTQATCEIHQPVPREGPIRVGGTPWRPSLKLSEDEIRKRREKLLGMMAGIKVENCHKQQLNSFKIQRNAKHLLAIAFFACLSANHLHPAKSSLVQVYHKYRGETETKAPGEAAWAASDQHHPSKALQLDEGNGANSRVSTIEFGSPMKRIMDLIGHHVPVIVLDSGQNEEQQQHQQQQQTIATTPTTSNEQRVSSELSGFKQAAPTLIGTAAEQAASGQQLVSNQQQLLGQQQQQHWTVLQQQQSPGQQQQLVQPAAVSNEQYFAFAPMAVNQVGPSNPFGHQQYQSFMSYPDVVSQQQTASDFNQMAIQTPQPSQNHQQQLQHQQVQNEVQPVFLSSYVPELPPLSGSSSAFVVPREIPNSLVQGQHQQPNSIQQIQQAQKQQQPSVTAAAPKQTPKQSPNEAEDQSGDQDDSKSTPADGSGGDDDSGQQSGNPSDGDAEQPQEEPRNTKHERAADGDNDGDGEPSSGSISYEDKYDSDKDDADQKRVISGSKKSSATKPLATVVDPVGLRKVGLTDECLLCICRASSGCDLDVGCIPIGTEERYCGPFQLTQEYWERASKPRDAENNFSSFEDCANDSDCATETITNYMKKYHKDCDGDNLITCLDYALIHRLQPDKCNQTELLDNDKSGYWQKFESCDKGYSQTRNGDDEHI